MAEGVNSKVLDRIAEATAQVAAKNYTRAYALLDEAQGWRNLTAADRTALWSAYAEACLAEGNRVKALAAYREILKLPNGDPRFAGTVLHAMAQIHVAGGQYAEAEKELDLLEKAEPLSIDALALRGQINKRLGNDKAARDALERAARQASLSGRLLGEADYRLLGQLQFEAGDRTQALETLGILTRRWPSKTYFMVLASLYGELNQSARQIAVLEAVKQNGWLTSEPELMALAQLYLYYGVPNKAAHLLEDGLQSGIIPHNRQSIELLSTAYVNAREFEKAIPLLLRAAELSKSAELYLRLARLYNQIGDKENVVLSAQTAMSIGGVQRPDELLVLKGMAEFDLGRLEAARRSFAEAAKYKASADLAQSWIAYIDNEERQKND
nr:tetratricopeptide repeat protein [Govania unica]